MRSMIRMTLAAAALGLAVPGWRRTRRWWVERR